MELIEVVVPTLTGVASLAVGWRLARRKRKPWALDYRVKGAAWGMHLSIRGGQTKKAK